VPVKLAGAEPAAPQGAYDMGELGPNNVHAVDYVQIITHFCWWGYIDLPAIRPASEHGRTDK